MTHKYTLELTAGITDEMSEHEQYVQLHANMGKWKRPDNIRMYARRGGVFMEYFEKEVKMDKNRAVFNSVDSDFVGSALYAEAVNAMDAFFYRVDEMRERNASYIAMATPMNEEDGYPYYSMFLETVPKGDSPYAHLKSYIAKKVADFGLAEDAVGVSELSMGHGYYTCMITALWKKNAPVAADFMFEMAEPSAEFTNYVLRMIDIYMGCIVGFPEELKVATQ